MLLFATSDKGGTGRTVTGSNIMYRRALRGHDVCYVDFDFGSPTAGAVFGVNSLARGTSSGAGTHAYLGGRVQRPEFCDVWANSDRMSLRNRPPGSGRLVLIPGDIGGGEFPIEPDIVRRCMDLFLRLDEEFEIILVDLSAGRSFATEIALGAAAAPELSTVQWRWLVFHRWTRQHIMAAAGLVYGKRGLLEIGQEHGWDRELLIDAIRYVRTAIVDPNTPDLAGLRPAQLAWLRECNRELQTLAAQTGLGRAALLGSVPLDPVLQWREQLITDSDVWANQVANEVTVAAFESLATVLLDQQAWERL